MTETINKRPKILVLVLSSKTYPSRRNKKAIQKTWAKNNNENCKILFYESGNIEKLVNDTLYVKIDTDTKNLGQKFLLALEWCNKNVEFDFLFRTNTSSYLNLGNLERYISKNISENTNIYCGIPMIRDYKSSPEKINFLSGSGFLLNKKVVSLILENKNTWDHNEWEDVALGKLMSNLGVPFLMGKTQEIKHNFYNNKIDLTNYHIRCRIDTHYGYPRFLESKIFYELDRLFKGKKNLKTTILFNKYIFYIFKFLRVDNPKFKLYRSFRFLLKKLLPKKIYNFLKKNKPNFLLKFLKERF